MSARSAAQRLKLMSPSESMLGVERSVRSNRLSSDGHELELDATSSNEFALPEDTDEHAVLIGGGSIASDSFEPSTLRGQHRTSLREISAALFTPSTPASGTFRQPRAPIGSIPRQSSLPLQYSGRIGSHGNLSLPCDDIDDADDDADRRDRSATNGSNTDEDNLQDLHIHGSVGRRTVVRFSDDIVCSEEKDTVAQHEIESLRTDRGQAQPTTQSEPPSLLSVYTTEVRELMSAALPVVTSSSLTSLLTIVDLIFIGQWLGPEYLAAGTLGNAWFNILYVLLSGAADSVDKACSNAIDRGDLPALGIIAQRGVVLLLLAAVPVMVALGFTRSALQSLLHQGAAVSTTAGVFCESLIIGMLPLAAFLALTVVLRSQAGAGMSSEATWHIIYIDAIANLLNVAANGALIEVDGFLGAPLATSACRVLQLMLLAWYLYTYRPFAKHGTWSGWHLREAIFGGSPSKHSASSAGAGRASSSDSSNKLTVANAASDSMALTTSPPAAAATSNATFHAGALASSARFVSGRRGAAALSFASPQKPPTIISASSASSSAGEKLTSSADADRQPLTLTTPSKPSPAVSAASSAAGGYGALSVLTPLAPMVMSAL